MRSVRILEEEGFEDIVISAKATDTKLCYDVYKELSQKCDYPLHIGVTEAGTYDSGIVRSAAGIGGLLLAGIGDTIRVSLTGNPLQEVLAARKILDA